MLPWGPELGHGNTAWLMTTNSGTALSLSGSSDSSTAIIASVATVCVLMLVAVVIVVICCRQKHEKRQRHVKASDSSSSSKSHTNDLPSDIVNDDPRKQNIAFTSSQMP